MLPIEDTALQHVVRCVYCQSRFDLFRAAWCNHGGDHPSKSCPYCLRCVCLHPLYDDPQNWREAPRVFQDYGFRRLSILYV